PAKMNSGGAQDQTVSYYGKPYLSYNHTGWILLLPFLDQDTLFKLFDPTLPMSNGSWQAPQSAANLANAPTGMLGSSNQELAGALVKVFVCPADQNPRVTGSCDPADFGPYA